MRDKILAHAVRLSTKHGFSHVTRSMVATSAKVAPGSVSHHFDSMGGLYTAVMREAVAKENLVILAQGLIAKHPVATHAPETLRTKALQHAIG